jgi:hypothetical protein
MILLSVEYRALTPRKSRIAYGGAGSPALIGIEGKVDRFLYSFFVAVLDIMDIHGISLFFHCRLRL